MPPQNATQTNTEQRDELLSTLTNQYCRFVLRYFGNASEKAASVEDLSTTFARENDGGEDRVALHLHHTALPKLSDVGVVEYDARSKTVRYHGHPRLEDLIRVRDSESELAVEVQ